MCKSINSSTPPHICVRTCLTMCKFRIFTLRTLCQCKYRTINNYILCSLWWIPHVAAPPAEPLLTMHKVVLQKKILSLCTVVLIETVSILSSNSTSLIHRVEYNVRPPPVLLETFSERFRKPLDDVNVRWRKNKETHYMKLFTQFMG